MILWRPMRLMQHPLATSLIRKCSNSHSESVLYINVVCQVVALMEKTCESTFFNRLSDVRERSLRAVGRRG